MKLQLCLCRLEKPRNFCPLFDWHCVNVTPLAPAITMRQRIALALELIDLFERTNMEHGIIRVRRKSCNKRDGMLELQKATRDLGHVEKPNRNQSLVPVLLGSQFRKLCGHKA